MVSNSIADEPTVFEDSIAPMLRQNCVACHFAKKSEGGLNLENFASLSRGGDSGPSIDLNEVDKSILLDRITGHVEPIMPPVDNTVGAKPLTSDQIALVKRWITQGAVSKASPTTNKDSHQPLPANIQSSYAIAVSPDGEWLFFSRGNDLIFQPVVDWSQLGSALSPQSIVLDAHSDSCFALAVSPDGQRVASGSSGEVKLWRRRAARLLPVDKEALKLDVNSSNSKAPPNTKPTNESKKQLTLDGVAILRFTASQDGSLLASLDQQQRLQLWNAHDASLVQEQMSDQRLTTELARRERDVERQKRKLERWNTKLVELKAVVEKEATAVATAQKNHETSASEWEKKKEELQVVVTAVAELEKSILSIQAAIEAAKQQSTELAEKQKLENADLEKLQLAATGTLALIELGSQKLAELTAQLEPKKKSATELQTLETAAKAKFEETRSILQQSQESHQLAIKAAEQKQALIEPEPKKLESLDAELARCKKAIAEFKLSSKAMVFTGDNKYIVSLNDQNQLDVFKSQPLQRIAMTIPLEGAFDRMVSIGDREVRLSGPAEDVQHWSIGTSWELECTFGAEMPGMISDRVNALAFNNDGTRLAIGSGIGSRSGHLTILELGNLPSSNLLPTDVRIELSEPEFHSDTILGIAYSPDGRSIATCSADKMIKIIDVESLKTIRNLEGHTHHVLAVAWQEDGLYLSTTSGDGSIKVWDVESGESTRTLNVGKELTAVSFVGTTNHVVSAVIDNTVRMHDIHSNDQVRQFNEAQNALYSVAVSPDGRIVVASGQEGIPRAWKIDDGKLVAEIKMP
ncbi:MAG: c-type cytochrome domain-containing protein [Pirellulaceae bacterium]|nr:c-type cytochrome domain-containing protein [Pirellulaceae bacterium]